MMRVLLLIATNLAVMLLASITLNLLGVGPWLSTRTGIDFGALLATGAVLGFGGAFFSLAISKWMAKTMMGVEVIGTATNERDAWLVATVERLARDAGIGMPEVGVFDSSEPNAFATGASRNHALVAVSTGLMARMNRTEVEAVLGHEVTHVANGDMVTLTLIQGVLNTFVFVLSRLIGFAVDNLLRRDEDESRGPGIGFFIGSIVSQLLLGVLASMIVMWFSRRREYRADAGGARLAGRGSMIAALEALRRVESEGLPPSIEAMGIRGSDVASGLQALLRSHPPLEERIRALQSAG
jgi:heat shock protein HtpX